MAENASPTPDDDVQARGRQRHPDSDGIADQVTVEDTVVTPLDSRDPYRLFWLTSQIVLFVSTLIAAVALIYGLATGTESSWISGMACLGISMLSVIGLLLARLGSDLKSSGVI
ncbi:Putative membrane protein [Corynebacterium glyciniphilum AJ 3170]|uniref:Putative membrane protein n=1 Tax=Corynebacterium glyciniphilum AJ 3170 TaxID=1404245 RepID=X5DTT9_9CORY|nr:hypothetical protein [Corynebacterium glyciniphilum]AHW64092.1 Putative membrane protein [Corynebacterium glyciniphilum AJ 3170]